MLQLLSLSLFLHLEGVLSRLMDILKKFMMYVKKIKSFLLQMKL